METAHPASASSAGRGAILRLANGPFGRGLIGIALGVLVFAAHQSGLFRPADLEALGHWGSSLSESAPPGDAPATWAIVSVPSESGLDQPAAELYGSAFVLLSVLLMLVMGDRGLRGKFVAGSVALVGIVGVFAAGLGWWRLFIAPWPFVATVGAAFVVAVCIELAEAGSLIEQEARSEAGGPPWAGDRKETRPRAHMEETLRSIVTWHQLPGAALLLKDAARPGGLVTMSADGAADWSGEPSLEALARESLEAQTQVVGDWPGGGAKAVAVPIVLEAGRAAALVAATPRLPIQPEVIEFGVRAVRQLLAARTPRPDITLTMPNAAARPEELPLPAQVARLRGARHARQQQAAFAAAWRAGPHEAVVVFDIAGEAVLWNRRAETLFDGSDGQDLDEMHVVSLLARASGLKEEEVREVAMGVLLHGDPYICDIEDPIGKCNFVASLTRIASDGESPGGLALRCIDVTGVCRPARVEARLMSVAAHEMRTPLTSVLGYAELLSDRSTEGSVTRRYAESIHRQASRMEAIVGELLTVTRLEAGREELLVELLDMGAIARQVVTAAKPMADAGKVALSVQCNGEARLRGDLRKLERVVENLVMNAIKYSPQGASVEVRVRRDGEHVVIEVEDTGHGIAVKDAPHVFEKFYRAKNQHTEGVEGTGLGLAIARLIAEAHGGGVSVNSAEGEGSTFTVSLPVRGPAEHRLSDPAA